MNNLAIFPRLVPFIRPTDVRGTKTRFCVHLPGTEKWLSAEGERIDQRTFTTVTHRVKGIRRGLCY